MRLLIWCPTLNPGGGERLLLRLLQSFLDNPAIARVAITISAGSENIFNGLQDPGARLRLLSVPNPKYWQWTSLTRLSRLQQWLGDWSRRLARRRLQRAFDRVAKSFDIAYCFWAQHELFIRSKLPIVATIQDLTLLEFPEILGERRTSQLHYETQEWLTNSLCVVSSRAMEEKIKRLFVGVPTNVHVVHHAISPNTGRTHTKPSATSRSLPADYLIYPANLNTHKNHYALLNAYARWSKRGVIPLVLTGPGTDLLTQRCQETSSGWQVTRLRGLIRRLELREGTDFFALGYISESELMQLTQGAWCLIMPSLAEGGGSFPVEEALDLGVPVACSDIPVMREHLAARNAKIAWFDPESGDKIIEALDEMHSQYAAFKKSSVQAQRDVRPTWTDVASEYVRLFESALQVGSSTHLPGKL